jgi:hypothetical protein
LKETRSQADPDQVGLKPFEEIDESLFVLFIAPFGHVLAVFNLAELVKLHVGSSQFSVKKKGHPVAPGPQKRREAPDSGSSGVIKADEGQVHGVILRPSIHQFANELIYSGLSAE